MLISLPDLTASAPFAASYRPPPQRLQQRLGDFLNLLDVADRATSEDWRAKQFRTSPLTWTGRICQRAEGDAFQPLSIAMEAAFALIRARGKTPMLVALAMYNSPTFDDLAISSDISRDDPAWIDLITATARNWHDDDSFEGAMVEVAVWAFLAWVATLPAITGSIYYLAGRA